MNQKLQKTFQNPPAEYRGKPFWSWNGKLEKAEILRQIDVLKAMGMGGYFCHSRTGLATEYLGDEWFALVNACADKGKKLGMEAWLYDEDRWPSGTAGGMVTQNQAYRMKYIRLKVLDGNAFCYDENCIAAFAVDLDGLSFRNKKRLSAGEDAKGRAVLEFSVEEMGKSEFYNGYTYVDTMNAEATEKFIELTHEKYRENCGGRLGKSIYGIFTDEPNRGAVMSGFSLPNRDSNWMAPYTPELFGDFREKYGVDLVENLPELFLWKDGEKKSRIKWQYMELIEELFLYNFLKPLHDWCEKNGIQQTGHLLHEDSLTAQSCMIGSIMRGYEYFDTPGVDVLTEHNQSFWIVKQLQSAARQLGREKLLSELYGATGWQFNFEGHKEVGDWQALFGINMRCHHLSWYTMQGEAKRDYPASINGQSAWYPEYGYVEDYFSRIHVLMSQGSPVCDLLVLNPVESVWMQVYPGWCEGLGSRDKDVDAMEARYADTFHLLCGNQIDFDYGDEDFLTRFGSVAKKGGKPVLRVGKAAYAAVLVTGMQTMRRTTLELLRKFVEAGGRVVLAGDAPAYVDAAPSEEVKSIGAEETDFSEKSVLEALKLQPPVTVTGPDGAPLRDVYAQVREKGPELYIHLLNLHPKETRQATVMIHAGGYAERWDARTGGAELLAHGEGAISFRYDFAPAQELLVAVTPENRGLPAVGVQAREEKAFPLEGSFRYRLDEPNVCVLDFANYRVNDEAWRMNREILKADREIRTKFGLPLRSGEMVQPWFAGRQEHPSVCRLKLSYPFKIDELPKSLRLAVETPEKFELRVNGKKAFRKTEDFWVDSCFHIFEIDASALKVGSNRITLETDFRQDVNLEAIYLLGDFGVSLEKNHASLTKLPRTLRAGDISEQGLPFYGAGLTYVADLPDTPEGARLFFETDGCDAACIEATDGENSRMLAFQPYRADVTALAAGKKALSIRYILTRRNTFGPLHENPVLAGAYGPGNFTTEGKGFLPKSYGLIRQGMTYPARFVVKK